ncbi:MAG: hypothetical protein HP496_13020 [Nitrospira sp.]|nr:hypothetical protein [Nitrospira sp.]
MDWSLLIGLLTFIACTGAGIFFWRGFAARLRTDFRAEQPALRITNLSALNTGDVVTLTPDLENVGQGVAYDCVLQLAGWEGSFSVNTLYPQGPRYHKHSIPIVLGPTAPIRMKPISRCYLRLACHDRWEQPYEYWYPVTQAENLNSGLYDIHINLAQPELTEPHASLWKMWTLLRKISAYD